MASSTSTGARLVFKVGGVEVAFANSVSYSVAHTHQPVDILGQPEPAEYAETGYVVNLTANMFRVFQKGAISQGLRPNLQDLMRQPELNVTVLDKVTGATIMNISRVKCTQEDFNVDARSIGQLNLTFIGITQSEPDATGDLDPDNSIVTSGISRNV